MTYSSGIKDPDCLKWVTLPILTAMKLTRSVRYLCSPIIRAFLVFAHPVFFLPFVAGAAFSYLCPEHLPSPLQAFAEGESEGDISTDDEEDLIDLGSPRPEKRAERDKDGKKKKKELPSRGVLSQTRSSGTSGTSVPGPWGGDALDKSAPPITGSVSRTGNLEWAVRIFNNSEDTYSVSVEVVQMGRGSKRLKSDNYSYTLKPKGRAERKFKANQGVTDCVLNLTRWKNLTAKKKSATPTKAPAETAAKVAESSGDPAATPSEGSGASAE